MIEFVLIQNLEFREILRNGPGKHATYGSVDILRMILSKLTEKVITEFTHQMKNAALLDR